MVVTLNWWFLIDVDFMMISTSKSQEIFKTGTILELQCFSLFSSLTSRFCGFPTFFIPKLSEQNWFILDQHNCSMFYYLSYAVRSNVSIQHATSWVKLWNDKPFFILDSISLLSCSTWWLFGCTLSIPSTYSNARSYSWKYQKDQY